MADPYWHLGPPSWFLEPEPSRRRQIARELADTLPPVKLRSSEDGEMPTMVGAFASFNEWTEIRSAVEGNFLERMSPSAFVKAITQDKDKIRVLFHHGQDPFVGAAVLGPIRTLDTSTAYEVPLLDADYTRRLLPGLRAGQYGASFRFTVVKDEHRPHATRSEHNPKGLPEVTVTEAKVMEFGPTPFPAYRGSTAGLRSTARPIVPELIRASAYMLGKDEKWVTRSKPGSAGIVERERVLEGERASWEQRWQRAPWWLHVDESEVAPVRPEWFLA